MQTKHSILITLVLCVVNLAVNAVGAEPGGTFKFVDAEVQKVLEAYQAATGSKLITASNVADAHGKITIQSKGVTSASDAARVMAHALLEQAGVVITRLDSERVSVTYNDALKITPVRGFPQAR